MQAEDIKKLNHYFYDEVFRRQHVDERLAFSIGEVAERLTAAEVVIAVGVTPRAAQRTFTSDFDGEIGAPAREDLSPRADDAFHLSILFRSSHFEATNIISTSPSAPTKPVRTVARAGKFLPMAARYAAFIGS